MAKGADRVAIGTETLTTVARRRIGPRAILIVFTTASPPRRETGTYEAEGGMSSALRLWLAAWKAA